MRKSIVLSVATAFLLLAGTSSISSSAPDNTSDQTPTFYRLVPGTYVNGWPRFTVNYPKDWVEQKPSALEIFCVASPDPTFYAKFVVQVYPNPLPLDKAAEPMVRFFRNVAQEVTVVADNPSRLTDGTPAREVELKMVINGLPSRYLRVVTKKDGMWVATGLGVNAERIDEDLKAFSRSFRFEPDKDKPVKVPPDIQAFLDGWSSAFVSHDLARVMSHFSDRFLGSGVRKGELERSFRGIVGSITSDEVKITEFVPMGDTVYLAGFETGNFGIIPLGITIIKENGEWKWYGNQREVAPGP